MKLRSFKNNTGEGVVSFSPPSFGRPKGKADSSSWFHSVLVAGKRVFEYGCPCGTCGIVFRKVGLPENQVCDEEAFRLLGSLDTLPSDNELRKLARVLEPGQYYSVVVEGKVRRIEPGTPDDYFATDVVRLFGYDSPDSKDPKGPWTPYYRFGTDSGLLRSGRTTSPHNALVTSVIMPLHDPLQLDRKRVEYWLGQQDAGIPLTAFGVAVIDNQAPADEPEDINYEYEEQFLFTICLLDGHHRLQAAAESGMTVRILTLLSLKGSKVWKSDIPLVLRSYSPVLRSVSSDKQWPRWKFW